jgi:hypothetical protein
MGLGMKAPAFRYVPSRKSGGNFDFNAKRRKEIVMHARHVGAADSDDLNTWLIAWIWHNPCVPDQIWAVMQCARKIGREITEGDAAAVIDEAAITRKCWKADPLARFLGVTYLQRKAIDLRTIGSINVRKRARKELRKLADRRRAERKRRARGVRRRQEYLEANSLSATKPWEKLGMSRRTWERHRNKNDASPSATILLTLKDRPASPSPVKGLSEEKVSPKSGAKVISLSTDPLAADRHAALPLELRMAALCLPLIEMRMAA